MALPARPVGSEASPARSRRRSLVSLLSAGHLVMIVAGLVGMLLTLSLLRNADERVRVAVAARDLRAGNVVRASDLRYERVRMDGDLLATVLEPDDVADIAGSVATAPVREGELVPRAGLRPVAAPSRLRAVSIPIDPARAVNGDLLAGDRVDVVLVAEQEVTIVVAGAEVLDVHRPERGGAFGNVDDQFTVTLAVNARQSQLLAAAVTDGDVLVARSTGAASAESTPPLPVEFVEGGEDGGA